MIKLNVHGVKYYLLGLTCNKLPKYSLFAFS